MLKYYIIIFGLLSLVFSGCGSKSPEPLDEEVLDLEYVKQIEEEERKQEEKATELLALEAALKATEAEAAAETAAETAKETAEEAAVQEKLLAQPELQTPVFLAEYNDARLQMIGIRHSRKKKKSQK